MNAGRGFFSVGRTWRFDFPFLARMKICAWFVRPPFRDSFARMSETQRSLVTILQRNGRSRVTNARLDGKVSAKGLIVTGDARSVWARRYRDLCAMLIEDAGGMDALSELRLGLIRRAATLMIECERLESRLANGEEVDVDLLARLSSHLRRIAETIGLDRAPRTKAPTLEDIAARIAAEKVVERDSARAAIRVAPASKSYASGPLRGDGEGD
jgi:hypothetical protein